MPAAGLLWTRQKKKKKTWLVLSFAAEAETCVNCTENILQIFFPCFVFLSLLNTLKHKANFNIKDNLGKYKKLFLGNDSLY